MLPLDPSLVCPNLQQKYPGIVAMDLMRSHRSSGPSYTVESGTLHGILVTIGLDISSSAVNGVVDQEDEKVTST